jgi:hypothetical protein
MPSEPRRILLCGSTHLPALKPTYRASSYYVITALVPVIRVARGLGAVCEWLRIAFVSAVLCLATFAIYLI